MPREPRGHKVDAKIVDDLRGTHMYRTHPVPWTDPASSMRAALLLLIACAARAAAKGKQYETLGATCKKSEAVSGALTVISLHVCLALCDADHRCTAIDTDGTTCYLKSHCVGRVGECSGWCGLRQVGTDPMAGKLRGKGKGKGRGRALAQVRAPVVASRAPA